ncbi:helix-turn-helix domain-containing protein [Nocardioides sp. zg-536]|uniref:Helix-turn-helix domain-containing protein n=1 Tax=Nocardioides faecalis TaxID=2803858 RepID=A0A939C054_9ACTN|nr:helix-turn-helix domain-containing protein [Nocardioides faecalis]MBM9461785.1 helix-turn-helix domain-containing protein [Nocardioides faecalis]QVI60164.1 helix-turn-helix domain-containing protein [Nocardioides faecalis]
MGRPPVIPADKKLRIVLSVLAGEMTIAEAARREKISEQSIGRWKAEFLEAGKQGLLAGKSAPTTGEQQLEAEVADLTQALGKAAPGEPSPVAPQLARGAAAPRVKQRTAITSWTSQIVALPRSRQFFLWTR